MFWTLTMTLYHPPVIKFILHQCSHRLCGTFPSVLQLQESHIELKFCVKMVYFQITGLHEPERLNKRNNFTE